MSDAIPAAEVVEYGDDMTPLSADIRGQNRDFVPDLEGVARFRREAAAQAQRPLELRAANQAQAPSSAPAASVSARAQPGQAPAVAQAAQAAQVAPRTGPAPSAPSPSPAEAQALASHAQRDLINVVLRTTLEAHPSITDMIVHVGSKIWFKSARGTKPFVDMFQDAESSPLNRAVQQKDIGHFLLVHVMGCRTKEQAESAWQRVTRAINETGAFSESIRLDFGSKARVMLFKQGKGQWALNVRVSRSLPPMLDELSMPAQLTQTVRGAQRGLILITGPLNSGKTTTSQAILQHVNLSRSGHIVTIEDPIETDLRSGRCLITTKEVGQDTPSFHQGLKDALRQSVNTLFIGELRDADTASVAIQASASGILVIATVHGDTCVGTLSKISTMLGNEGPSFHKLMAQSLVAVIRQAMVPNKEATGWYSVMDALLPIEGGSVATHIAGGQWTALEQMIAESAKQPQRPGAAREWISMNERLLELIVAGKVNLSDARQNSSYPKGLTQGSPIATRI